MLGKIYDDISAKRVGWRVIMNGGDSVRKILYECLKCNWQDVMVNGDGYNCPMCKGQIIPVSNVLPKEIRGSGMNTQTFEPIIHSMIKHCQDTLCSKAKEYATGSDRLHNFKVAQIQNITPIQALAGMMAKHTVSVYDMCQGGDYPLEMWQEKIGDSINYLLLLRALVDDTR